MSSRRRSGPSPAPTTTPTTTGDAHRTSADSGKNRQEHPGSNAGLGGWLAGHQRLAKVATTVVLLAVVFHFFVLPLFANFDKTLATLRKLNPWWMTLAMVLELLVWWQYGQTYRLLLPIPNRPPRWLCFATSVAAKGVSHVLPAGQAGVAAVDYKLMRDARVPNSQLIYAFSAAAVMSGLTLTGLLAVSVVFSTANGGQGHAYLTAFGLGAGLVGLTVVMVWLLTSRTDATASSLGRWLGKIPGVNASSVERGVRRAGSDLRELKQDRRRLLQLVLISISKWVIGAIAAWVVFVGLGRHLNFFELFIAFALANVMAMIPASPGGLGIYEATMIATLVGFGTTHSVATAGVLAFRTLNFWLPIPLGAACYVWVDHATANGHGLAPSAEASHNGGR